ncbi:MAG: permease [Firmicutes bacterium ML8_F2]|jgi:uncharacterized membrane protein YraQ (UPF0718 family)|nr:MAG: permease [Firmicutes bacterium ML8_F2]
MSFVTTIIVYVLLTACVGLSLLKSREKTKKAFIIGARALWKMAPGLLAIVGVVGLILGILPPETISRLVGEEAGLMATATAAILGAITLIPALISFPLAGSLLRAGATVNTIAAFITTLVMVGFVTAPLEIKALGKKFTLLRNGMSFIAALIIAAVMGVILT